jgi:hypothetical protein
LIDEWDFKNTGFLDYEEFSEMMLGNLREPDGNNSTNFDQISAHAIKESENGPESKLFVNCE